MGLVSCEPRERLYGPVLAVLLEESGWPGIGAGGHGEGHHGLRQDVGWQHQSHGVPRRRVCPVRQEDPEASSQNLVRGLTELTQDKGASIPTAIKSLTPEGSRVCVASAMQSINSLIRQDLRFEFVALCSAGVTLI